MAVPEQTPYIEHTGNGVTTSFSLGFQCESKDHLIVLVDEIEPPIATWSLTGGNVVFTTAPAAGKKITLERNTPFNRNAEYQSFNNSFRPQTVNIDFDRIWWKLQELGVADWLMKLYVDRLHQQQEQKINDLKGYVDDRDDELRAYLLEEIRKQGVALDQLDDYYNYLMQRLAQIAVDKGWDASFVVDGDKNQHQWNNEFKKSFHIHVHDINDMALIDEPIGTKITLHDGLRSGEFTIFPSSDTVALDVIRPTATTVSLSEAALADTFRGIYIQTQNGVAVRQIDSTVKAGWFGVSYDWDDTTQTGTDDSLRLEAAMHYALSQQFELSTENGAIRTTKQLTSQKDGYWKSLNWHANETRVIVDYAGSGIRFSGGARQITQTGVLTFEKSVEFKTTGGNTFPPTTDLNTFLTSKNAGVIFDGNRHSIDNIITKGFNAGVLFYAGSNMNYSNHNLDVRENDVGVLMFGPSNDLSVIRSEIHAYANYQEAIYVKDGTNLRQWVARFRAENNLLDRITNPAIAGRYAVYIGHHISCDFWCYVEQYAGTTPGTLELYISDTGSSEVFSSRRNTDYLRGNNQGKTGNTIYQNFFTNPPTIRESTPLKLEGRGVRLTNANDFVDFPIRTTDGDYGGLRGQEGRIKLRSATSAQEVSLSDSDVRLGKNFNTVVVDAVTLLTASPTATKTIKTLSASNEAVLGTLHVVGGAFRASHGYAPYVLKLNFYINNGAIVLDEAGKFYNTPSEGNSSAALRLVGNVLYLDLAYTPAWWGDDYKFKYKVELLTGIQ